MSYSMQEYFMQINTNASPVRPVSRLPLHTRTIGYRVFSRSDGLWDVEGSLHDLKEQPVQRLSLPPLSAGDTVHHMRVTVTLDDELRIVAIEADLPTTPFGECQQTRAPLARLVGHRIGRGWRRSLEEAMGGVAGCTHLRELLQSLATAAMQGINAYRDQQRADQGLPALNAGVMPHFVNGCHAWRLDGTLVRQMLPEFAVTHPTPLPAQPPEAQP